MSARRSFWLVGLSHRTAPVELREQLALENGRVSGVIRQLLDLPGIEEAAAVSTCNRVELVACGDPQVTEPASFREILSREQDLEAGAIHDHLYLFEGRDAVRHLFRVASSLDSMVVGEPQILGQLKQFYQLAADAGGAKAILHRAFHRAFSAAKRVRSETGIASRSVSVASVSVDLATQIFETLEDKKAMVIGAGKMAELTARHLRARGIGSMIFANRTFDRAVELAREYHGTPVRFEEMPMYLRLADVVIGSTAASEHLLGPDLIGEVLRERKQRAMFLIDLAVPRNFDPAINQIANVYVYDIDDLQGVLAGNREERSREASRAEAIVEQEVDAFWQWFRNLDVVPTIVGIREKAEDIRRREVERMLAGLPGLGDAERRAIEAMSESLINKLLHPPIARLKRQEAADSEDVAAARRLFGLDDDD